MRYGVFGAFMSEFMTHQNNYAYYCPLHKTYYLCVKNISVMHSLNLCTFTFHHRQLISIAVRNFSSQRKLMPRNKFSPKLTKQ